MQLLLSWGDAEQAVRKVKEMLATGQKVPGFGHRVYRTTDPRANFLRKMSKQLGEAAGNTKWYEMSERLIPIMKDTVNAEGKAKNLNPNVDFFSASAYYTMGIPLDLFTPIFAIARAAGVERPRDGATRQPTESSAPPTITLGRLIRRLFRSKSGNLA